MDMILMYLENGYYHLLDILKPAMAVFLLLFFLSLVILRKRALSFPRIIAQIAWSVWFLLILRITGMTRINWLDLATAAQNSTGKISLELFEDGLLDEMMFLNLLLFIPFGFLLPVAIGGPTKKWRCVLIISICFPLMIELSQWQLSSRYAQLDDLLMNASGTMVGYYMYSKVSAILKRCVPTDVLNNTDECFSQ